MKRIHQPSALTLILSIALTLILSTASLALASSAPSMNSALTDAGSSNTPPRRTARQAQANKPTVVAFAEPSLGERGATRVLFWNQVKNEAVGEIAINYGQPVWKPQYENKAMFDLATKGKVWRLGNNYWTILDLNLPAKIAGKEIPIGLWYLGLYRSEDGGSWSLAFIDPVKARSGRIDPFAINTAPVEFKVPIALGTAAQKAEKLEITLAPDKDKLTSVALTITWGTMQLTVPIEVTL